jgi:DNA-binding GntR family transcriptional regulator
MTKRLLIRATPTIRKKVYDFLRQQILLGQFKPRERLVENRIAAEIGTSRTPVREALHSLEMEGLLEAVPRVGYVVKPMTKEEVEEICQIRMAIESLAGEWVLQRARQRAIRELKKNIARAEERLARGRVRDFVELDAQFHEILARCSGSSRLLEMAQRLRSHMLRYRIQSIYSAENVARAIQGHKAILEALETGDSQELAKAISKHIEISKQDIIRYALGDEPGGKPGGT